MEKISFGLLDFGLRENQMGALRIQMDTVEYAMHADALGFKRFWLAEHYYSNPRLAWTNPEPIISLVASVTKRIKVGSAGILLGIHQPFHVAAYFKLLNNLYPNRIDLGVANGAVQSLVGRSTVGKEDHLAIRETFDEKVNELLYYLRNEDELFQDGEGVVLPPYKGLIPEVWALSVSYQGLSRALNQKLNFTRSIFHQGADPRPEREQLEAFREQYYERHGVYPKVAVAISGCCQESDLDVKRIVAGLKLTPERHILGSINEFYDRVMHCREAFGIDEFIFKDVARDSRDRLHTLQLVSEKFNLN